MQSRKSKMLVLTVAALILVSLVAMPLVAIADTPAMIITVGPPPADYPTIQEAVDAAANVQGDVVIQVAPGLYDPFTVPWGTDYVTIESTGGPSVTGIGMGFSGVWISGSYVTLRGFTILYNYIGVVIDWSSQGSWIVGNVLYGNSYGIIVLGDENLVEDNDILWGSDLVLSEEPAEPDGPRLGIVVGKFLGIRALEDAVDFVDIQDATDANVGELLADDRVAVPEVPLLFDAREVTDQPAEDDPAVFNTVRGNIITDYWVGIVVMWATDTFIEENTVMFCYIAIALHVTDQVYIVCNTLKKNSWGIIAFIMDDLVISGNLIREHIWIGITLVRVSDILITRNRVRDRNWIGILAVETWKLKIKQCNRVLRNHRSGIVVAFSGYVRIKWNRANGNQKCGILLWRCGENVIVGSNKAKWNFEDGITLVNCGDYAVRYNLARYNDDDGIQIAGSGDGFVHGNKAFDNRDWDLSWVWNTYDPSVVWTANEFGPKGYDWFPPPYPDA